MHQSTYIGSKMNQFLAREILLYAILGAIGN
jgi:hypothetical protein